MTQYKLNDQAFDDLPLPRLFQLAYQAACGIEEGDTPEEVVEGITRRLVRWGVFEVREPAPVETDPEFEDNDPSDPGEKEIREFVMDHMYAIGKKRALLGSHFWQAVYLVADGFGTMDVDLARDQCWDWSHVRDSSPAAFERMAKAIRAFVYN